jgi:integrase
MRVKHYSLRTEKVYVGWIRRFILANAKRHPREMGAAEVEAFPSLLAVQGKVAASTQNQALSALLFLYRVVLGIELPWLEGVVRAKRPKRVPTVLSHGEVQSLLAHMEGRAQLLASLLYGTGMRLMECLRLRVKDVDCPSRWLSRCSAKSSVRGCCMPPIWPRGLAPRPCRTHWRASIPRQRVTSAGSTCFRPYSGRSIRTMALSVVIISTTPCWRAD